MRESELWDAIAFQLEYGDGPIWHRLYLNEFDVSVPGLCVCVRRMLWSRIEGTIVDFALRTRAMDRLDAMFGVDAQHDHDFWGGFWWARDKDGRAARIVAAQLLACMAREDEEAHA